MAHSGQKGRARPHYSFLSTPYLWPQQQCPRSSHLAALCWHAGATPSPVSSQETVAEIKAPVVSLESTAPKDPVLLLAGTLRENEAALGQCGLEVLSTLEAASLSLGPWFPGPCWESKGQTPSVAEQEKKKTGWAKKPRQRNQHFVSAVPTLGKKGPNANSQVLYNLGFL